MKKELNILHLGDIHFDSPFSELSGEEAARRNEETRRVFSAAIRYARERRADIVLLCGDVFDGDRCSVRTRDVLIGEMKAFPSCRFIISPGNHDPYSACGVYQSLEFPENCHVFGSDKLKKLALDELDCDVYGYAFTESSMTVSPLDGFTVADGERFNILCAHADVGVASSNYAPVSELSLAESGLDYAAFGHVHNSDKLQRANGSRGITASNRAGTLYAYSGCLCGRDYGECGRKGGIFITLSRENGVKSVRATRVTFCPWLYREVAVDIGGLTSVNEVIGKIAALIPGDGDIKKRYLRVMLSGRRETALAERLRSLSTTLEAAVLRGLTESGCGDGSEITVLDGTELALSYAELENDYTVRGAFYRALKPKLESGDPVLAKRALKALNVGLTALDGGEPFDVL